MANSTPVNNASGLPQVTPSDLKNNDPSRLNRITRLLASQLSSAQNELSAVKTALTSISSTISTTTTVVQKTTSGGGGGGAGSFSSTGIDVIQGTHIQRLAIYLPADQPLGSLYYETDRTVTYLNYATPSTSRVWLYLSGTMIGTFAGRPGDLTTYDSGFVYYASDRDLYYRWNGTTWAIIVDYEPTLMDTHANRQTLYPSVNYSPGQQFYESDRGVFYVAGNATGTASASGTTLTWLSGDYFVNSGSPWYSAQWPVGTPIIINSSVTYSLVSLANSQTLTINTTISPSATVTYSVDSGKWQYQIGAYNAAYASLPTDLGAADTGFIFNDTATYIRSWEWQGTAWNYAPGQLPNLALQLSMLDTAPAGWHVADGSTVTATTSLATTGLVALPNPSGLFFQGGTTYTGSTVPAIKTTMNSYTPAGSVNVGGYSLSTTSGSVDAGTGAPSTFLTGASLSGGGSATFTGTPATLTVNAEGSPAAMVFPLWVKL